MKTTKKALLSFVIIFPVLFLTFLGLKTVAKEAITPLLSPALSVISSNLQMRKCGLNKNNLYFTSTDFEDFMQYESLNSITVTTLPSEFEGKLYLADVPVISNQTIQSNDINKLYFKPASTDVEKSTFYFHVNNSSCESSLKCSMFLLDEINTAPTIVQDVGISEELLTQKNIMLHSTLYADDNENDEIFFELTSEPKHGITSIDVKTGKYTYTPAFDYIGKDSFEYVAYDIYGNRSQPATVEIVVEKNKNNTFFSDMVTHKEHNSAIKAADYNIMSGKIVDGKLCFMPSYNPTKAEFVCMVLKASGIDKDIKLTETAFADDSDIPSNIKGYIAYASNQGYINGTKLDSGVYFYPNSPITRAEAAVIINNIIGAKSVNKDVDFSDKADIPSWASDDIATLSELNIMDELSDGKYEPNSNITNAQCAEIFCKIYEMK